MNDIATITDATDLAIIPDQTALAIFTTDGAIDPLLARIRQEIDAFAPDLSTAVGRKAIASMAYKVAQSKTRIDDAGKTLVAKQKEIPNKIDATRKKVRDTLDKWRDEVRRPLTEWEEAEKTRLDKHKARIEWFKLRTTDIGNLGAAELRANIGHVQSFRIGDDCEEFVSEYTLAKVQAEAALLTALEKREKYEAEQAELERLRAAAAEQARKDHEDRIAHEAAERATRAAADKADAERKAAEEASRREREAAERRELELKLQAEQAERRAAEAEVKAKADADRKAAAETAEIAKREADTKHRATVNKAVFDAFVRNGLDVETATRVVTLIAQRGIPHVTISY